jgi:hypothetical protein
LIATGWIALLLLGTSMLIPAGASGPMTGAADSAPDPEDVEGRLDIVFVRFRGNGDGTATLTIKTAERWRSRFVKREPNGDEKQVFLVWQFNSNRDRSFERTGRFYFDDAKKHLVFEKVNSDRVFRVRRPNRRMVKVTVPVRAFRLGSPRLKVRAQSTVNGVFGESVFIEETDLSPTLKPR